MKQQVQGGTGDLFYPNNCFTQAAPPDASVAPACWSAGAGAWIAMLPSHFNAFSAETMTFCCVLCRFWGLLSDRARYQQRLTSLFWIIPPFILVTVSSPGIHPPSSLQSVLGVLCMFVSILSNSLECFFFFWKCQLPFFGAGWVGSSEITSSNSRHTASRTITFGK